MDQQQEQVEIGDPVAVRVEDDPDGSATPFEDAPPPSALRRLWGEGTPALDELPEAETALNEVAEALGKGKDNGAVIYMMQGKGKGMPKGKIMIFEDRDGKGGITVAVPMFNIWNPNSNPFGRATLRMIAGDDGELYEDILESARAAWMDAKGKKGKGKKGKDNTLGYKGKSKGKMGIRKGQKGKKGTVGDLGKGSGPSSSVNQPVDESADEQEEENAS
jgi:hypothetical protein